MMTLTQGEFCLKSPCPTDWSGGAAAENLFSETKELYPFEESCVWKPDAT